MGYIRVVDLKFNNWIELYSEISISSTNNTYTFFADLSSLTILNWQNFNLLPIHTKSWYKINLIATFSKINAIKTIMKWLALCSLH